MVVQHTDVSKGLLVVNMGLTMLEVSVLKLGKREYQKQQLYLKAEAYELVLPLRTRVHGRRRSQYNDASSATNLNFELHDAIQATNNAGVWEMNQSPFAESGDIQPGPGGCMQVAGGLFCQDNSSMT